MVFFITIIASIGIIIKTVPNISRFDSLNKKYNVLAKERIKVLEATVAQLNTDNNLLVEKLEKGYEKLKTVVNSSMNGWNSGNL